MVHLAPVATSVTAQQSAAIFLDLVYRHHGLPTSIVSNRDPCSTSSFWSEIFQLVGTRLKMSTVSHPETDDQTERANRVVEDLLHSFATSYTSWSSFLRMVEFAINNAVHSSTGLTPFYVNHGRHSRVPALLGMDRPISDEPNNTAVATAPIPAEDSRAFAHDAAPAFLSAMTTRRGAAATVPRVQTRVDTRGGASFIAAWTSRTLINPRQRRRAVEYHATPGSAASPESPPASFEPNPEATAA